MITILLAKDQAEEMIEMMTANTGDRLHGKQCAAIGCKYIINSNPCSDHAIPHSTKHYWEEVLNYIIVAK